MALLHFALELVYFQTMTLLSALQPMVVAGEQAQPNLLNRTLLPSGLCAVQQCLPGMTAVQQLSNVLHMQPSLVSGWGQAGITTQTSL